MILITFILCHSAVAFAQQSGSNGIKRGASDAEKMKHLRDRIDALKPRLQAAKLEEQQALDALESLQRRLEGLDGQDAASRDMLEEALKDQDERAARALQKRRKLQRLDSALREWLSKLEELGKAQTEINRLTAQHGKLSSRKNKLEEDLRAARSRQVDTDIWVILSERIARDEQELFDRAAKEGRKGAVSESELKRDIEFANKKKSESRSNRGELRRLREALLSLDDEILSVKAMLKVHQIDVENLEKNRPKWDREPEPDADEAEEDPVNA
jgi:hypothetical protein